MKDEKEALRCDECGTILKTGIPDQDSRGFVWCRKCGLVYDPSHPMGRGFSGLKDYMIHNGLNNYIDNVRLIYNMEGLAEARLQVATIETLSDRKLLKQIIQSRKDYYSGEFNTLSELIGDNHE